MKKMIRELEHQNQQSNKYVKHSDEINNNTPATPVKAP